MNEIDYLLSIDSEGVKTFSSGEALLSQVREWLNTPKGQVWGRPQWGNLLAQYKHQPINDIVAASMESFILLSIGSDLPNVQIQGIRVIPLEIDYYRIKLIINGVKVSEDISL